MSSNESGLDRLIRLGVAAAAVVVALVLGASSALGILLFVVAAIMVATAVVGFCPLYRLFGLRTNTAPRDVVTHR